MMTPEICELEFEAVVKKQLFNFYDQKSQLFINDFILICIGLPLLFKHLPIFQKNIIGFFCVMPILLLLAFIRRFVFRKTVRKIIKSYPGNYTAAQTVSLKLLGRAITKNSIKSYLGQEIFSHRRLNYFFTVYDKKGMNLTNSSTSQISVTAPMGISVAFNKVFYRKNIKFYQEFCFILLSLMEELDAKDKNGVSFLYKSSKQN